jgi:hypothetical protein
MAEATLATEEQRPSRYAGGGFARVWGFREALTGFVSAGNADGT